MQQACPVTLQRSGIAIDTDTASWKEFVQEAESLFSILNWTFQDFEQVIEKAEETGKAKWWTLVCGEKSWMSVSVRTPLSLESSKKMLMLAAGVEREMTMLSTPIALLRYCPVSRALERWGVRQMGREKARLWKDLRQIDVSDKRKESMYQRDKEKWLSGFGDEDAKYERMRGRRREWLDMIADMDDDEFSEFFEDISAMRRGMALSSGDNARESIDPPELPTIELLPRHSTILISELTAYTELLATLTNTALSHTPSSLTHWLENFRASADLFPIQPLYSFTKLLHKLRVSAPTKTFWIEALKPHYPGVNVPIVSAMNYKRGDSFYDPFASLRNYIERRLQEEREYIPGFIERYDKVGGFYPTSGRKSYALLLVEEQKMKHVDGGKKSWKKGRKADEGWLSGLGEVRVADANEIEIDIEEERGRGTRDTGVSNEVREGRVEGWLAKKK
jgi:hypothetical protein